MNQEQKVKSSGNQITCECGAIISSKNLATHQRTKKHIEKMQKLIEREELHEIAEKELAYELPENCVGHILMELKDLKTEVELTQLMIEESLNTICGLLTGESLGDIDEEEDSEDEVEEKKEQKDDVKMP